MDKARNNSHVLPSPVTAIRSPTDIFSRATKTKPPNLGRALSPFRQARTPFLRFSPAEMATQPSISSTHFPFYPRHSSKSHLASPFLQRRRWATSTAVAAPVVFPHRRSIGGGIVKCSLQKEKQGVKGEETSGGVEEGEQGEVTKVSAVLFDMDGVLCNSEEPSRMAAVDLFAEMGVSVTTEDLVPFTGTGEANFLGGVAKVKGVEGFDPELAKKRFFEIYLDKYAKPDSGIGFPGALELVMECKKKGLKVAVASSADRIKVDANLIAAGIPSSLFDGIISADAFENLKPAPDILLAASLSLNVLPGECIVVEDALAGVQAAKTAQMRCIAVTTTLSQEALQQAGPSLIRKEIGDISLHDILETHASSNFFSGENPSELKSADTGGTNDFSSTGLQVSRREIVRYGSFGLAVSCLLFTVTNWKAMQYVSPNGVLNALFGYKNAIFGQNQGKSQSARIQQIVNYISDLEARDASYVPEFPAKLDWLNTAPLQFKRDLKGKVVLLDFWTYCCINCMHVLPDLEFLENKYSDKPFTVVGVHSAKFDNEKDLEAIRNAVLRYNITHPVVNDGEMYLWRDLGITSWPTFVLIGPNGKLLAEISGEGRRKDLDDLVGTSLQFYDEKKLLNYNSIPLALEKDRDTRLLTSPLKFPGKLAVDVLNNRLFISDSNHNRIVVTDLEGNFILQVGSTGEEGLQDGPFEIATFNRPQGVAYNPKKNTLYVADTENHALREIDFVNEMVRTLAGNGTKGSDYIGGRRGTNLALNSPWDVCFEPNNQIIYIAMAGQHQIWEHRMSDGVTRLFSGDGYERNVNGSSSTNTSFAQPSGLSFSPDNLEMYVADSESSSIRAVNLETGGSKLLAGGDPLFSDNLFKFGDHDGTGSYALFQHPLGVFCGNDGQIYIADSYNHKVKKLDPLSKQVVTLAGTGTAGFKDASALSSQLSEPSGIIELGTGRLLIADTNNNAIRYLDLNEKNAELRTLELKGVPLPSPNTGPMRRLRRRVSSDMQVIKSEGSSSMDGNLCLKISIPEGYHFSKEASSKFDVEIDPQSAVTIEPSNGTLNSEGSASFHFRRASPSPATGRINCKVYYCKEDEVCLYQALAFDVPFQQETQVPSPSDLTISYTVKPKIPSSPAILGN